MKEIKALQTLLADGKINRRDFLRQTSALGFTAAVGAQLASSAFADGHATPQHGGHFKVAGAGSSTDSYDPTTYDSFFNGVLGRTFGDRLVRQDIDGSLLGELAESWSSNDDFSVWTLNLRQGVEFHNGKSFTASDVVYSLGRHYGEGATSGAAGNLTKIQNVSAVDDNTVEISLSEGNIDFVFILTDYHLIMQPEGSTDDGIGTGAFIAESLEPGVRATFRRNPNYWNNPYPYYDSFELLAINDDTARTAALQTGQVHAIDRVDLKTVGFLQQSRNVQINNTPSRGHYNFIAHTNTNPFDNADVMMALKYALPRQQIIDQVLNGFGGMGNDHPINGGFALFENGVAQREFDLDQARFHYEKSGHSGTIVLESSQASWPGATDAALLFKEAAAQAGIDIEVKRVPADGYWSNVWNVNPFCASYWIPRATQDQIFTVAYTGDWNDTRFENAEFSDLLVKARTEADVGTRAAMYTRMQQLVHDNSGSLIPVFNDWVDAISTRVKGYENNPNQTLCDQRIQNITWFG